MPPSKDEVPSRRASLSEVLKAVRRHKGLRPGEVAAAMGMRLRTYEHFESGAGRLNAERVHAFAEAVNADPFAIFAALDIGSPGFAVRCADNQLMTILMKALQDFDAAAQGDIARLEGSVLIAAFTQMFDGLRTHAQAEKAFVQDWMATKPPSDDGDGG